MGVFFLRGILIGVVFGVPAGAIGALCLQRSFSRGFLPGLVTGLASSAADCLYACVGLCGLSVLITFLEQYEHFITIAGAALIAVHGIMILCRKSAFTPDAQTVAVSRIGLFADFFSALVLALSGIAARFQHLLTERSYQIINRILGVILLVLAVVLMLRLYLA